MPPSMRILARVNLCKCYNCNSLNTHMTAVMTGDPDDE
jgi:hypothetical protein